MLTVEEQKTWRAVVPIVSFMYVRMYHMDWVKRQLGGEQPVPKDPVNLDGLLDVSARGRTSSGRRSMRIDTTTKEHILWMRVRIRHLSPPDVLDDPHLDNIPNDVPLTVSQPRDRLS
ncbi:hypothetical protein PIB30_048298 [Stylosanthes scabra]|uniref:Uncharacterized protein n=1 Tax=Stylosanthes scabra TaxID=79078 RepID=A0ABU6VG58_9FABA|nr:hypothetical protein [Stylosanthes scabra]